MSTSGDTQLGGTDVDKAVMDYILDEFKRQNGIDISNDRMAMARLKEAAEKAKIELSTLMSTEINLPFLTADASGPKHLTLNIDPNKTGILSPTNRTANTANNTKSSRRRQTYTAKHRQNHPHRRHDPNAPCPKVRGANRR